MRNIFLILFLISFSTQAEIIEGISLPSADVLTNFVHNGRIIKIQYKVGDRVKSQDLLAKLDDSTERKQLAQQKFLASNTIDINRAEKELQFKTRAVEHLKKAVQKGAAAAKELDDVELDKVRTEMDLLKAKFEQKQHKLKAAELEQELKKFELRSSISGIIEDIKIEVGENADLREPAFRIVQTNPLWIDAAIPVSVAKVLRKGKNLELTFPSTPGLKSKKLGKIIYISSVADPASDTISVRLAVTNKENRLVGERVLIAIPKVKTEK